MTTARPKLPADAFYAQFHNVSDASHSVNHPTKEWWEVYPDLPETDGKAVSYARGGDVKKPEAKSKSGFGSHPAHKIPGVHIVTADAGDPIFTGDK